MYISPGKTRVMLLSKKQIEIETHNCMYFEDKRTREFSNELRAKGVNVRYDIIGAFLC